MDQLLLHSVTAQQLATAGQQPPHALLLVGPLGTGKRSIARQYATDLLGVTSLESYPYVLELDGRAATISVEQVRALRQFMQRKTTGNRAIRRVCLLYEAGTMTTEAANALLKTLEEPPEDTVIVLTAETVSRVPLTIQSRVQAIAIRPVSKSAAQTFFGKQGYADKEVERVYYVSGGRAALMSALLADNTAHPLNMAITEAKRLLSASVFDRLSSVEQYAKDKDQLRQLLFGLERITHSVVQTAGLGNNRSRLERARRSEQAVQDAQAALEQNVSPKLLLTDLCLNM